MRVALVNPPVPAGKFTNRDLMGGMGIDDGFGVGLGPRFVAALKNEGTHMPVLSLASAAALLTDYDVTVLDQSRLTPDDPAALAALVEARPDWILAAVSFAFLGAELRYLARAHERTGARRMLVGATATHLREDIVARGLCEAITLGDPEVAVRQLARGTLAPGRDGVCMADASGRAAPSASAALGGVPSTAWREGIPDDFA